MLPKLQALNDGAASDEFWCCKIAIVGIAFVVQGSR
jgi:hypothetical protein